MDDPALPSPAQVVTRPADGPWGRARTLDPDTHGNDYPPQVAVRRNGDVVAVYDDVPGDGQPRQLVARERVVGQDWGPASVVTTATRAGLVWAWDVAVGGGSTVAVCGRRHRRPDPGAPYRGGRVDQYLPVGVRVDCRPPGTRHGGRRGRHGDDRVAPGGRDVDADGRRGRHRGPCHPCGRGPRHPVPGRQRRGRPGPGVAGSRRRHPCRRPPSGRDVGCSGVAGAGCVGQDVVATER